jgi:hypothetical protein
MWRAEGEKEMKHMTDPRRSAFFRKALISAGVAAGFSLLAAVPASAAPIPSAGLASPGLQVEAAGYRHSRRQLYVAEDGAPNVNYGYVYPGYRPWMPFHGSIEIQELQRMFPETNWPRSMRY